MAADAAGASRQALLVALGADPSGSGLFLPLALVYLTRDVGQPLATAGTPVSPGTVAGQVAPPVADRLTDRIRPPVAMVDFHVVRVSRVAECRKAALGRQRRSA